MRRASLQFVQLLDANARDALLLGLADDLCAMADEIVDSEEEGGPEPKRRRTAHTRASTATRHRAQVMLTFLERALGVGALMEDLVSSETFAAAECAWHDQDDRDGAGGEGAEEGSELERECRFGEQLGIVFSLANDNAADIVCSMLPHARRSMDQGGQSAEDLFFDRLESRLRPLIVEAIGAFYGHVTRDEWNAIWRVEFAPLARELHWPDDDFLGPFAAIRRAFLLMEGGYSETLRTGTTESGISWVAVASVRDAVAAKLNEASTFEIFVKESEAAVVKMNYVEKCAGFTREVMRFDDAERVEWNRKAVAAWNLTVGDEEGGGIGGEGDAADEDAADGAATSAVASILERAAASAAGTGGETSSDDDDDIDVQYASRTSESAATPSKSKPKHVPMMRIAALHRTSADLFSIDVDSDTATFSFYYKSDALAFLTKDVDAMLHQ